MPHTCSIAETLTVLADNHILSAPVYNLETGLCLGSVDVLDLVTFVLAQAPNDLDSAMLLPVATAVDVSLVDPFLPVLDQTPLSDVLTGAMRTGAHRVPVVNIQNELVGVFSQFDLARFLHKYRDEPELQAFLNTTVSEAGFVPGIVHSVSVDCTLDQCFKLMIANKIGCVGVETNGGTFVGNLSASDFRGVRPQDLKAWLSRRVGDVVRKQLPIVIERSTTFKEAVDLFVAWKVHRLYIVEDSFRPVGLVTLTDLVWAVDKHLLSVPRSWIAPVS